MQPQQAPDGKAEMPLPAISACAKRHWVVTAPGAVGQQLPQSKQAAPSCCFPSSAHPSLVAPHPALTCDTATMLAA